MFLCMPEDMQMYQQSQAPPGHSTCSSFGTWDPKCSPHFPNRKPLRAFYLESRGKSSFACIFFLCRARLELLWEDIVTRYQNRCPWLRRASQDVNAHSPVAALTFPDAQEQGQTCPASHPLEDLPEAGLRIETALFLFP